jgi:hypothetical protein
MRHVPDRGLDAVKVRGLPAVQLTLQLRNQPRETRSRRRLERGHGRRIPPGRRNVPPFVIAAHELILLLCSARSRGAGRLIRSLSAAPRTFHKNTAAGKIQPAARRTDRNESLKTKKVACARTSTPTRRFNCRFTRFTILTPPADIAGLQAPGGGIEGSDGGCPVMDTPVRT